MKMDVLAVMWENDKFIKPHHSTIFDLKQFIKMREAGYRTVLDWDNLKRCYVTNAGRTIWSLSEAAYKLIFENGKPIGQEQPTTQFIRDILSEIEKIS